MKHKLYISLPLLFLLAGGLPQSAAAAALPGNSRSSEVTIDIMESPLRLSKVRAPTFGTYETSSRKQRIQATGDLEINVLDERTEKNTPWTLSYELTLFNSDNGKSLGSAEVFDLGTGILTGAGKAVAKQHYQANEVELSPAEKGRLLQVEATQEKTYRYTVPKEKIVLVVPAGAASGNYHAAQTVTLVNVPDSN